MIGLRLVIKVRLYGFIKKSKMGLFKKKINDPLVLWCACFNQKN